MIHFRIVLFSNNYITNSQLYTLQMIARIMFIARIKREKFKVEIEKEKNTNIIFNQRQTKLLEI